MKLRAGHIARIRYGWFGDKLYDLIEQLAPAGKGDQAVDLFERLVERPIVDRLLPWLCAHDEAIPDCPNPDHDVCRGCEKSMPGMAPRRRAERT